MTKLTNSQRTEADINRIMSILPHRYPFLMIDKVTDIEPEYSGIGIKNISISDPVFRGHFPDQPVFPGVLIIESMAQTCAIVASITPAGQNSNMVYLTMVNHCRFRQKVVPGDQLKIRVVLQSNRRKFGKFICTAYVSETKVAEAEISAFIDDTQQANR